MDSSVPIQAVTILILVLLSAFFSSAETSMTAANRIRIHSLAEQGNKRAITLEKVISNSNKMLSTILIGNSCGFENAFVYRNRETEKKMELGGVEISRTVL